MTRFEKVALKLTHWIGTSTSLVVHSLIFAAFLVAMFFFEPSQVLLVFTTMLSMEAIYLTIFLQMSVNKHSHLLSEVSENVDELMEEEEENEGDSNLL